ncbi:hypothetical protein Nepgr_027245 [Nepenthes gracilis]|uniref:Uncharacterized protein n=1 Tax=Nepenthes gracilis TaxID=150966 RepID=A0AAD3T9P6_NEPGR|nr:hypothetical protein Nepgr_027245 [Nepenthes gracilis]
MESKHQTNSEIILSDEMKDDPNGKDCIRMEFDNPIASAWSLSEHQKKPIGLLAPGVESKTKENEAMSQQHPNYGAASVDSYPEGIGFLPIEGRDSPLEDQERHTQIVDDVLMCGNAQQENIKMERHPVSYADIMKCGILNPADVTGPPAIGKASRIGSASHVVPDHHQRGELSPSTKLGQLRRNILELRK